MESYVDAQQATTSQACAAAGCDQVAQAEPVRTLPLCPEHARETLSGRPPKLQPIPAARNGGLEPEERRRLALELTGAGWSHVRTAQRLGISKTTVENDLRGNGRSRKSSPTEAGPGRYETRALALVDAARELDVALVRWRAALGELTAPASRAT